MTYREFKRKLMDIYDEREAKSIALLVYEQLFGLGLTDICMGYDTCMTDESNMAAERTLARLLRNEPVQYVLGYGHFGQSQYVVKPGVLIPRPETASLVQWVIDDISAGTKEAENTGNGDRIVERGILSGNGQWHLLDCCCGSGCIALEIKRAFPGMQVSAYDISDTALEVSHENARRFGIGINFFKMDALNPIPVTGAYDILVSNPPYICEKEKAGMRRNVLDYEPAAALFVPDDDPLRFYCAIARYARHALKPNGRLYFEMNPLFAEEMKTMLCDYGFHNVIVNNDYGYTDRMIRATI